MPGRARRRKTGLAGTSRRTRPRRIFDQEQVIVLRRQGLSYRAIAKKLGLVGAGDGHPDAIHGFQNIVVAVWHRAAE